MLSITSGMFIPVEGRYRIVLDLQLNPESPVEEVDVKVPGTNIYISVGISQPFQVQPEPQVKGYIRVSTKMQTEGYHASLKTQKHLIQEYCVKEGLVLDRIYEDVASGKDLVRQGLQALLGELS